MTVYSDEVNIYDPDAISEAIDEAADTAEAYIADMGEDGIKVHSASDSVPTTFVQIAAAFIDFVRSGSSYLKMWLDGAMAKVRVGFETSKHMIIDTDGIHFHSGNVKIGSIKPLTTNAYPLSWGVAYDTGQWQDGANGIAITFNHMTRAFSEEVVGGFVYVNSTWYQIRVPMDDVIQAITDAGIDPAEVATSSEYNLQFFSAPAKGSGDGTVLLRSSTNTSSTYDMESLVVSMRQVDLTSDNLVLEANITTKNVDANVITGGIASNFTTSWHVIVNASSVTGGGYLSGTVSLSKSGYMPIGVVGQTSDQRYVTLIRAYISNAADGSGTLNWMVYNPTTSAKTPTMQLVVLWAKS